MLKRTHTQNSWAFRQFRILDERKPRDIVRFYKDQEKHLQDLEFRQQNYVLTVYVNALFKLGHYQSFLKLADRILELSIIENVRFIQGEDVFRKTLFQKGYAYFYLHDYLSASYIAKELIKMYPHHRSYKRLLQRCMIRKRPPYVRRLLGIGVGLYFFSVILVIIEQLVISNFYESAMDEASLFRMGIFGLGLGAFVIGEGLHHWQIGRFIRQFAGEARMKKK